MHLLLTDSLGFPRDWKDGTTTLEETYIRLLHNKFRNEYFLHDGHPEATADTIIKSGIKKLTYFQKSIKSVICNFGVVDAAPRALLPKEIQALDKLIGVPGLFKDFVSANYAEISKKRGYPMRTTKENFRNYIQTLTSHCKILDCEVYFIPIQLATQQFNNYCPTFNTLHRDEFNSIFAEISNNNQNANYLKHMKIEKSSIESFLCKDGHHLSAQGHSYYAEEIGKILTSRTEPKR